MAPAPRPRPLVSVVVPNYNHARYLRRRIDSVLAQSVGDFELLLLDDASTDESREVLASYRGDPRVRTLFNDRNSGGPFPQWNRGVRAARGRYVWIAESDDEAEPGLLEALLGPLEADDRVVLSCCESRLIDERGAPLMFGADYLESVFRLPRAGADAGLLRADFRRDGRRLCREHQRHFNLIPNASGAVFRRDAYLNAGGAPVALRLCGDWLTWGRIMLRGEVAYTARPLNRFRTHPATVRSTSGAVGLDAIESDIVMVLLGREAGAPEAEVDEPRRRLVVELRSVLENPACPLPPRTLLRLVGAAARVGPSLGARSLGWLLRGRARRWPTARALGRWARRIGLRGHAS